MTATVAAASQGTGNNTSFNVVKPTGVASGDLLIAVNASDWGSFAGNGTPTGFTALTTSDYDGGTDAIHLELGYKIAGGSEPANYSFPVNNGADCVGAVLRITGHDSTPVIAEVAPTTFVAGSGATSAPTITPNSTNDLLLSFFLSDGASGGAGTITWTPPSGMTEQVDGQSTTWTSLEVASLQNPSSPSGTKTATPSQAHGAGVGATLSIKSASTGTNLVINDALHASIADNLGVTQDHLLVINNAAHAQSADVLNLTQVHQIAIFDAVHATLADNIVLTSGIALVIQDATHQTTADGLILVQSHNLSVQDAFHNTTSSTISLVPTGTGGFMTVSDVQVQKLLVLTGKTGSIQDLQFAYYSGLSGLAPVAQFSVTDHQRKYWETQTGLTGKSMADLEKAFYDVQLIAAGSLADREYTYWTNV